MLELIARGHDSAGIALKTGLDATAIEAARARLYARLDADTVTDVLQPAFAARRAASH